MSTLTEAANAAGLIKPELLNAARTDIPPADAIAELRTNHPLAFASMAQLAREFELIDMGAISLIRPDLPARQAMETLKREYPAAFKPPFDARTATCGEYEASKARLLQEDTSRRYKAENDRVMARLQQKYGDKN